jgi:hypothetical protein
LAIAFAKLSATSKASPTCRKFGASSTVCTSLVGEQQQKEQRARGKVGGHWNIGGGHEPLFVVRSRQLGFEPIIPTNDGGGHWRLGPPGFGACLFAIDMLRSNPAHVVGTLF